MLQQSHGITSHPSQSAPESETENVHDSDVSIIMIVAII